MLETVLEGDRIFSNRDFDDLMYRVHDVPKGTSLMQTFEGLQLLPAFVSFNDKFLMKDKCIRYVVYCYDRFSPIYIKFRNEEIKRKTTAACYAGWIHDEETGLFPDQVNDMLMGFNPYVNRMIIDYVRQYRDPEYSVLVSGYESLYQKLQVISSAVEKPSLGIGGADKNFLANEEKKGKLYDQSVDMAKSLKALAAKILTDENPYLKKDLFSMIDPLLKNKLNISPESLAGIV